MGNTFGWVVCAFKGHDWIVDKNIKLNDGHKIEWKSCKRCNTDRGYRDHP